MLEWQPRLIRLAVSLSPELSFKLDKSVELGQGGLTTVSYHFIQLLLFYREWDKTASLLASSCSYLSAPSPRSSTNEKDQKINSCDLLEMRLSQQGVKGNLACNWPRLGPLLSPRKAHNPGRLFLCIFVYRMPYSRTERVVEGLCYAGDDESATERYRRAGSKQAELIRYLGFVNT